MNRPTVSLCVTAYNESKRGDCDWIVECIEPAIDNPMVDEIVVVNDGTDDFSQLDEKLRSVPNLRLVQNPARLHVFGNKLESVWRAKSDWVLMCDSDNIMDSDYYDALLSQAPWNEDTWYCASQAKPRFDYRAFIGKWTASNLPDAVSLSHAMFWCFVNTGNQFVHRDTFLSVFGGLRGKRFDLEQPDYFGVGDRSDEKWFLAYGACDSFYMMKEWLLAGRTVQCVEGAEYEHRIETGDNSNYERGPDYKLYIPPVYFMEMVDHIRGEQHTYVSREARMRNAKMIRDDGKTVSLDTHTGAVTVWSLEDNKWMEE